MRWFQIGVLACAASVVYYADCEATESGPGVSCKEPAGKKPANTGSVQAVPSPIVVYQDGRLILHTDLPPHAAKATLAKMKQALRFSEKHWRRRLRGTLDCYVAADTSRWPDKAFPHSLARVWIDCLGGATINEQESTSRGSRPKATLYASTRQGAASHEIVHAYCCQSFGHSGPDWYNEGLATVVGFGGHLHTPGVQCPLEVFATLREQASQTVQQQIQAIPFTSTLYDSLALMVTEHTQTLGQVPISCWTPADAKNLVAMRKAYCRSWSLCYLMLHDPNYQRQFRALGSAYLVGHQPSYQQAFGAVHEELAFDYRTFLQHIDMGYRVDLCSWEWGKTFRQLEQNSSRNRFIQAARGYQATGVEVTAGERYHYVAQGNWSTSTDEAHRTDANGQSGGAGRLEAVVLCDYQLCEPIALGTSGSFLSPTSGRLYVRCHDRWNQLADNRGALRVAFSRSNIAFVGVRNHQH